MRELLLLQHIKFKTHNNNKYFSLFTKLFMFNYFNYGDLF